MQLSVTGVFREKQSGSANLRNDLRSFHRTIVIVPYGSGFCIKNDMLHVNTLTMAQVKTAFKPIDSVPVTAGNVQTPIAPTPLQPALPDEITKAQMIDAFAQASKMNHEWSRK